MLQVPICWCLGELLENGVDVRLGRDKSRYASSLSVAELLGLISIVICIEMVVASGSIHA